MPSNTQKKDLKIVTYHLTEGLETTTTYLGRTMLEHIAEFVNMGLWASRSEFVRGAIYEKVIKTIQDNEMIQQWDRIHKFNESQTEMVCVPEKDLSYKTYNIVRRCE